MLRALSIGELNALLARIVFTVAKNHTKTSPNRYCIIAQKNTSSNNNQ